MGQEQSSVSGGSANAESLSLPNVALQQQQAQLMEMQRQMVEQQRLQLEILRQQNNQQHASQPSLGAVEPAKKGGLLGQVPIAAPFMVDSNWEYKQTTDTNIDSADYRRRTLLHLLSNTPYREAFITEKCLEFMEMGWPKIYLTYFTPAECAAHVHHLVAATTLRKTAESHDRVVADLADSPTTSLHFAPNQFNHLREIEMDIVHKITSLDEKNVRDFPVAARVVVITSEKPFGSTGTPLALIKYSVGKWTAPTPRQPKMIARQQSAYGLGGFGGNLDRATEKAAQREMDEKAPINIEGIATDEFLLIKSDEAQQRYADCIKDALTEMNVVVKRYTKLHKNGVQKVVTLMIASKSASPIFFVHLGRLCSNHNLEPVSKSAERFRNYVTVFSFDFLLPKDQSETALVNIERQVYGLFNTPVPRGGVSALMSGFSDAFLKGKLSVDEFEYGSTSAAVAYYFLDKRTEEYNALQQILTHDPLNKARLRTLFTREKTDLSYIVQTMLRYIDILKAAYQDFEDQLRNMTERKVNQELMDKIARDTENELTRNILSFLPVFNAHVLKTNFYKTPKAALAFRLDPKFMADLDYPAVPFGVFFVFADNFQGLHIRFSDIARGGIRVVRSRDLRTYHHNRLTQFWENYSLAFTQNLKNKDIPEKGSKGTILVAPGTHDLVLPFQRYVSALLDLIGTNTAQRLGIADRYGSPEILFLGPDENTADFMGWASEYAKKRGYPYWRSFTTGKPPGMGGIPHDRFGMTTHSVRTHLLCALEKMKDTLTAPVLTKFQTGGPDGDLGSNEILESLDREQYIAIVDGSGVLCDPDGLNRAELNRLAQGRLMIEHFQKADLGPRGFRVLCTESDVKLPDGTIVPDGTNFRNGFHLSPMAAADIFVPCGGRPEAINLRNVRSVIDDGKPRWKIIIEGANLFFTQDARLVLEEAGVHLIKDASANKGGVTSSSREVLATLALSDEDFRQYMEAKDIDNPPPFYNTYAVDVIKPFIADCATKEFEAIWREHERTGTPRCILTDQLSERINGFFLEVRRGSAWKDPKVFKNILRGTLPRHLCIGKDPQAAFDAVAKRIPENYQQAMVAAFIASRYVYEHGLQDGPTIDDYARKLAEQFA